MRSEVLFCLPSSLNGLDTRSQIFFCSIWPSHYKFRIICLYSAEAFHVICMLIWIVWKNQCCGSDSIWCGSGSWSSFSLRSGSGSDFSFDADPYLDPDPAPRQNYDNLQIFSHWPTDYPLLQFHSKHPQLPTLDFDADQDPAFRNYADPFGFRSATLEKP